MDFPRFYRKEIKIVLNTFISLTEENLKKFITLLQPFHDIFQFLVNRRNCEINSVREILKSYPEIFTEQAESVHAELEILLNSRNECTNFEALSKVGFKLRNVITATYKIIHLILIFYEGKRGKKNINKFLTPSRQYFFSNTPSQFFIIGTPLSLFTHSLCSVCTQLCTFSFFQAFDIIR